MLKDHLRRPNGPARYCADRTPSVLTARTRPRSRKTARNNSRPRRNAAQTKSARFHGPSFSGGIIFGALLVLVIAYLPELRALLIDQDAEGTAQRRPDSSVSQAVAKAADDAEGTPEPEIQFEFEELLSSVEVAPTAGRYVETAEELSELYLQAASFRTQEEADRLRADLLLLNLPTSTSPVELADGRWIRVTVGPFRSPVQANRAMTALRNRNIAPIWIKRKVTG